MLQAVKKQKSIRKVASNFQNIQNVYLRYKYYCYHIEQSSLIMVKCESYVQSFFSSFVVDCSSVEFFFVMHLLKFLHCKNYWDLFILFFIFCGNMFRI